MASRQADISVTLTSENVHEFINGIDTILLDCDGVLWRQKDIIPGVPETLEWLRKLGKRLLFVTNNSTESRKGYQKKIEAFGIECVQEEIWGSSFVAALYLKSIQFSRKAYIIGHQGLADEMKEAGIAYSGVEEHAQFVESFSEASALQVDPEIGAVVVGMDIKFTYKKMAYALLQLTNNEGCLFVGTNTDNIFPSSDDRNLPGGGTMVKMLEYCSQRQPTVVGKPNQWFLDQIVLKYSIDRNRTLMVGDKLSTDILFGNRGNLKTLLVFTGVTSPEYLKTQEFEEEKTWPHFTCTSLPDVMNLYQNASR